MSFHLTRSVRSTILGVVVVVSPFGAEALTVGRCNQLIDGVFKPVLVVKNSGQKTIHQIGEDGLNRTIVFNTDAAMAWASKKYGADPASVSYDDSCIGSVGSDRAPIVVVAPGGGGGDCGGGDCGGGDCGGGDRG